MVWTFVMSLLFNMLSRFFFQGASILVWEVHTFSQMRVVVLIQPSSILVDKVKIFIFIVYKVTRFQGGRFLLFVLPLNQCSRSKFSPFCLASCSWHLTVSQHLSLCAAQPRRPRKPGSRAVSVKGSGIKNPETFAWEEVGKLPVAFLSQSQPMDLLAGLVA